MPCRNLECQQNTMTEIELLKATIDKLKSIKVSPELAKQLDSDAGCMMCSNHRVARWLEELLKIKS